MATQQRRSKYDISVKTLYWNDVAVLQIKRKLLKFFVIFYLTDNCTN